MHSDILHVVVEPRGFSFLIISPVFSPVLSPIHSHQLPLPFPTAGTGEDKVQCVLPLRHLTFFQTAASQGIITHLKKKKNA